MFQTLNQNPSTSRKAGQSAHPYVRFVVLTVILSLLIAANMGMIFFFSSEGPEDSGNRSEGVTEVIIEVTQPDFDKRPPNEQQVILDKTHHFVRKMAHFSEFALLGCLSAALLVHLATRISFRKWMLWLFPTIFSCLYAVLDEVHQMFTSRGPAMRDVFIDSAGVLTGVILLHIGVYVVRRLTARRREGEERGA